MRILSLFFRIVLVAAAVIAHAEDESLTSWKRHYDRFSERRLEFEKLEGDARVAELDFLANAINDTDRLNAVLSAKVTSLAETAILTALLDDPAGLIRREAARKLFGGDSEKPELATKYKYAAVLENQKQADEILKSISTRPPLQRFAATRKLERIGLDAALHLRDALRSDDRVTALSAMSILSAKQENVEPRWLVTTREKLEKPISVEFADVPLQKCVQFISELTGARISIQKDGAGETPVNLRINEMKAATVLKWVCRLVDLEVSYRAGEVQLIPLANLGIFIRPVWVHDARDLLNSDDKTTAKEIIARIGKEYEHSIFGTKIEIVDGFVVGTNLESDYIQDSITKDFHTLRAKK